METEDMVCGNEVTIYVVKEENREKKRRRQECGSNPRTPSDEILSEIHANSRKLRQCSRYFETGLSARWTSDAAWEFSLEAHTEFFYYQDCFARMNAHPLFRKPIPSVQHCIELLKVASQIQCENVLDAGMKYLALVCWTADEEKQIREFCNSGYFDARSASEDFNARLDLPLTKEERQKKYLDLTMTTLRRHLQFLSPCNYISELMRGSASPEKCEEVADILGNYTLFGNAFHSIMADSESSSLQEPLIALVREETQKILVRIENPDLDLDTCVDYEVCHFSWLYELARQENISQVVVDAMLKVEKLNVALMSAEDLAQWKWAEMMLHIFEDLLQGHLFLSTGERFTLLVDWIWILNKKHDGEIIGEASLVELITKIVETFPLLEQQKFYDTWAVSSYERGQHSLGSMESVLAKSYSTWLTHLTREAAKHEPDSEDEDDSTEKT